MEKLIVNDPDLLNGWLHQHAEQLVWGAINSRDRSLRGAARSAASRSTFASAAEANELGDAGPLGHFLSCPYVVADGSRSPLAKLDRQDLLFVAETYDARSKQNAFEGGVLPRAGEEGWSRLR